MISNLLQVAANCELEKRLLVHGRYHVVEHLAILTDSVAIDIRAVALLLISPVVTSADPRYATLLLGLPSALVTVGHILEGDKLRHIEQLVELELQPRVGVVVREPCELDRSALGGLVSAGTPAHGTGKACATVAFTGIDLHLILDESWKVFRDRKGGE